MKDEHVSKSVSGLKWARKTCVTGERKLVATIRETMLLSASLLLVLLHASEPHRQDTAQSKMKHPS